MRRALRFHCWGVQTVVKVMASVIVELDLVGSLENCIQTNNFLEISR